jgi:hypothetical protein
MKVNTDSRMKPTSYSALYTRTNRYSGIWRCHVATTACAVCWPASVRIDVLVIDNWAMASLSEPE